MKRFVFLLVAVLFCAASPAQHPVKMRNLWTRPQVHVSFHGYTISFAIRDINKTLVILNELGETRYGTSCDLDTSKNYYIELLPDTRTLYHSTLQTLMQNVVGPFLITSGRAVIKRPNNKLLSEVLADFVPMENGETKILFTFLDPKSKAIIFNGYLLADLYKKDLGLED